MSNVALRAILLAFLTIGTAFEASAQVAAIVPLTPIPAAPPAMASTTLPGTMLFDGESTTSAVTEAPFGGGSASIDSTLSLSPGTESIRVESPGFYQGAALNFPSPVDLGALSDTSKYLVFYIKLSSDPKFVTPPAAVTPPVTGMPGGPMLNTQSFNDATSNLFHLAQSPSYPQGGPGPGQGGMPPGGPGNYGPQAGTAPNGYTPDVIPPPTTFPANSLHFILTLADGTKSDILRNLPSPQVDQDWVNLSVPISRLQFPASVSRPSLASVVICSDTPTIINIGQIKLVSDTTPITSSPGGEKIVSVGENIVFNGKASGGASMLKFQWDFDTSGPFISEAEGSYATHTYSSKGAYKVTLEVSDVDGIKSPSTSTTVIHVEQ